MGYGKQLGVDVTAREEKEGKRGEDLLSNFNWLWISKQLL